MRYRDIVLIVRDTERWRGILDSELERAGIPYFLAQRTDIMTKPVIKLLLSALALRAANWRQSDLLTYLKTGFTGLSRANVDLLEDYITRWQLQGEAIPAPNGWTMDPDGYVTEHTDRAATQLEQLNALRTALWRPRTNSSPPSIRRRTPHPARRLYTPISPALTCPDSCRHELPLRLNEAAPTKRLN